MKMPSILLSSAVLLLVLSSCDFFRGIAGRPGGEELRAKRERIDSARAQAAAIQLAKADSVLREQRFRADSAHAEDSLRSLGKLRRASAVKGLPSASLEKKYYIVVGAFSNEVYAEKLSARYAADGFRTGILRYRSNGLNTVYASPSDNIVETFAAWKKILSMPYAAKETWILVND